MIKFHIQADSEIPASNQLFNQIRFAIASRQFPPGQRLPSTRQLAMQTGLHRNTISKVYNQLEELGLVEAQAGSGIYVKIQGDEVPSKVKSSDPTKNSDVKEIVKTSLDELLTKGCTLSEARELFLGEIDWRLRCSARVLVTAPNQDIGIGKLMSIELEKALGVPIQLIPIEELAKTIEQVPSGTIVTSRYFIGEAEKIASKYSVRVIPVDIYNYANEFKIINNLPKDSYLGIVSLSTGLLRASEVIIHSLRGEDLFIMTAQVSDEYKVRAVVRSAKTIVCDRPSYDTVKTALLAARDDLIRPPQLICIENYIDSASINLLKRELGLS